MTITRRLSLAFSLLSVTVIVSAVMAILVSNGFQSRFQYVQTNSIPSIIDFGKLSDRANRLILLMYRHQSATSIARQEPVEKDISQEIDTLKSITQHYLDNYITDDDDRNMTENAFAIIQRIQTQLPIFIEGSRAQNDTVALGQLQSSDGVGAAARELVSSY
ncbi:MAG: hypothetical protein XXXJIFNMEKO3_02324 [Candidatus Erwinia impunctatus]|nr:hypothetical protein XXXJIFNMEKO_02324 [Culicoides impunctatus]